MLPYMLALLVAVFSAHVPAATQHAGFAHVGHTMDSAGGGPF